MHFRMLMSSLKRLCALNIMLLKNLHLADRECQQQGLSLWVPFQNAATAVTNLYKGKSRLMTKELLCCAGPQILTD